MGAGVHLVDECGSLVGIDQPLSMLDLSLCKQFSRHLSQLSRLIFLILLQITFQNKVSDTPRSFLCLFPLFACTKI